VVHSLVLVECSKRGGNRERNKRGGGDLGFRLFLGLKKKIREKKKRRGMCPDWVSSTNRRKKGSEEKGGKKERRTGAQPPLDGSPKKRGKREGKKKEKNAARFVPDPSRL